ncbi:MAG: cellulose-binding protein [Armatimonadetes bacterium]|nr:cellulose-binding protein [Armatimonadota bacterium]
MLVGFLFASALWGCGGGGVSITPSVRTLRVMPLGDSLTQGTTENIGYRRDLWLALQAQGANVDFVGSQRGTPWGEPPQTDFDWDHEGHWGYTTPQLLANVDGWLASAQPDIVLLLAGSNDLISGGTSEGAAQGIESLIGRIRAANPSVRIVLGKIPPIGNVTYDVEGLNARIEAIAARLDQPGSPIRIADLNTGFDCSKDTFDLVHPNSLGASLLSSRWLAALKTLLPSSTGAN